MTPVQVYRYVVPHRRSLLRVVWTNQSLPPAGRLGIQAVILLSIAVTGHWAMIENRGDFNLLLEQARKMVVTKDSNLL